MPRELLSFVIAGLMFSSVVGTIILKPTTLISEQGEALKLERVVPNKIANWIDDPSGNVLAADPQQTATLNKIYSQVLNRTYRAPEGYRIMLSIAYGKDQRDSLKLHYPEVCYPAQGFEVISNRSADIFTSQGAIPVKILETRHGQSRREPITYWALIGTLPFRGGIEKKIAEMRYGLRGVIPDGMLIRVSSIDQDSEKAFMMHAAFVRDFVESIDPAVRSRFAGEKDYE